MRIREAERRDLPAIDDIYHHYVHTSTCTMQFAPGAPEERVTWFEAHGPGYPVLVMEDAGEILAWASLSRYHAREGYRPTVEDSIYVRHDRRGGGIGRALLTDLIARAEEAGHHSILAYIDASQHASVRLHEAAGFTEVARIPEVGFKLGKWMDLVILQRRLG